MSHRGEADDGALDGALVRIARRDCEDFGAVAQARRWPREQAWSVTIDGRSSTFGEQELSSSPRASEEGVRRLGEHVQRMPHRHGAKWRSSRRGREAVGAR
ncbi:hypothetical protein [Kineococcus sp. SYSU DK005]|uniref:hypothetical protein n=1 Tax=Kineococcus sp. SYSU DK005 TaxID=3383126 RepID=UPI003D7DCDAC